MRRLIVSLIILAISLPVFSQMVDYTIESQKSYDNGTKTVYLSFQGDFNEHVRAVLEREFKTRVAIKQFSFYNQNDPTKLMYTATSSFGEQELDDIIAEVNASSGGKTTAKSHNISAKRENLEYMKFHVEGVSSKEEMKRIVQKLKSYDFIEYAAFGSLTECKLAVQQGADVQDVKEAFASAGVRASRK
jgi:hypothetical protein